MLTVSQPTQHIVHKQRHQATNTRVYTESMYNRQTENNLTDPTQLDSE